MRAARQVLESPLRRGYEMSSVPAFLMKEMASVPGRARNTALLIAQVVVTILIGETFRIPDLPVLVFICFFLSGNDAASNTSTALMAGLVIVAGTALTIVLLMVSLSEPGLRLPLMLLLTLAAGFFSQAMTMGALANILLFWIVYMAMNADLLESVGYALNGYVGNTTGSVIPDAAYLPPEESLLHLLLWIGAVFMISLAIIAIANKLAGHDPLTMLRGGIVARLEAVSRFCTTGGEARDAATADLAGLAEQGVAGLRSLFDLSSKLHPDLPRHHLGLAMIRTLARLVMIMMAWSRLRKPGDEAFLHRIGDAVRVLLDLCQPGTNAGKGAGFDETGLHDSAGQFRDDPVLFPLALELVRCLTVIQALLVKPDRAGDALAPEIRAATKNIFKPDAFTNPAYPRAAIRIALSVVICYAITRFTAWPGIQTCVVTCFLVSLGTIGDSVHKMLLRIIGALIGAFFGIGTILVIMPHLVNVMDLLLAVLPVAALAGWVKSGSERISYAGVQISMAYFMTILQGYGPTLDMETARNRVVGILIGNVIVYLMSALLWPVSTTNIARRHLTSAVRQFATLLALRRARPDALVDIAQETEREKFGRAIATTRTALQNAPFEEERLRNASDAPDVTPRLVTEIQMIAIPVAVLSDLGRDPTPGAKAHIEAMQTWFSGFADWLDGARDARDLMGALPAAPALPDDPEREAWFGLLESRLKRILDACAPEAEAAAEGAASS